MQVLRGLGWNTKISARETNYGTRIDYVLITPGLLPWVKHGDIQPALKGSDHCPIYIDLHDEVTTPDGRKLMLKEEMRMVGEVRQPPRLASKFWDEYSGRQKLLSSFFGKGKVPETATVDPPLRPSPSRPMSSQGETPTPIVAAEGALPDTQESADMADTHPSSVTAPAEPDPPRPSQPSPPPASSNAAEPKNGAGAKRKLNADAALPASFSTPTSSRTSKKKKKALPEQAKLSTFFAQPVKGNQHPPSNSEVSSSSNTLAIAAEPINVDIEPDEDADYRLALQLSQEFGSQPASQATRAPASKAAWSGLFAKQEAPCCVVHGEPAKLLTVNKAGPNKGRAFFVCSRCVSASRTLSRWQM